MKIQLLFGKIQLFYNFVFLCQGACVLEPALISSVLPLCSEASVTGGVVLLLCFFDALEVEAISDPHKN